VVRAVGATTRRSDALLLLALAGCSFQIDAPATGSPDAAPDAPPDARSDAPAPPFCPTDPELRVCFSFDQTPLPAMLPSEGTATVTATLTSITRIARSPTRGAAQFGATSGIAMPMGVGVTGVLASEVWFRADAMPATNGGRMGLFDSNTSENISLFFYRADPVHQLRCGLGNQTEVFPATLATTTWHYAACTCEGGAMRMYLDGVLVAPPRPGGCSAGAFVGDGFTIGSDNSGSGGTVAGDRIAGAIDGVRLWAVARTAEQIAATSASGL